MLIHSSPDHKRNAKKGVSKNWKREQRHGEIQKEGKKRRKTFKINTYLSILAWNI